jgi:nucleotide-binding universal stress UspA family protein
MRRILVGLDGSPRAPLVLAAAAKLAELAGAKLVLFRAVGLPPELPPDMLAMPPLDLEGVLRVNARAALDDLAKGLAPGLVERTSVEVGIAWDAIVRAARTLEVDLIAIGSHGYGGLDRLLGTTAAKVVNHADCNVFIIRNAI